MLLCASIWLTIDFWPSRPGLSNQEKGTSFWGSQAELLVWAE